MFVAVGGSCGMLVETIWLFVLCCECTGSYFPSVLTHLSPVSLPHRSAGATTFCSPCGALDFEPISPALFAHRASRLRAVVAVSLPRGEDDPSPCGWGARCLCVRGEFFAVLVGFVEW